MEEADDALKVIAKGAGIFSIGLIISKILSYIYRLIIARVGAEQYGLFSIALAILGILATISMLGMGEGVVRFVSFYKGKVDKRRIKGVITSALKINASLSIGLGLILFFFSDWIAFTFFHDLRVSILLKILAFALPLDVLRGIFFSSIRAFQRADYEAYSKSIAESVAKVILTLIAVYLGFGIVGVAFAYLLSIAISFAFSFYFLEKKVFPIVNTQIVSLRNYKELLFYSFPLLLTSFIFLIVQWTDTIMLGFFKTPHIVGIYNVALPTAHLLSLFPTAIRTLFFPVLNELYAKGKQILFKSVYRTVVKWIIIVNSIFFVFLIIFSKQIIRILFGEAYVIDKILVMGKEFPISSLALIILSVGMIFPHFLVPSKDILLVLKKTKLIFFNAIVGALTNIVLNYILIPSYGAIGAAIATTLAYFLIYTLVLIESYVITRINPFKVGSFKVLAVSAFILIMLYSLKLYTVTSIAYLTFIGLASFIVYLVLLLLTKSFEKEDLMILKSIKEKFNRKYHSRG